VKTASGSCIDGPRSRVDGGFGSLGCPTGRRRTGLARFVAALNCSAETKSTPYSAEPIFTPCRESPDANAASSLSAAARA
jgi:hypothetical protein